MYKLTLADGTELDGLSMNGTTFVSKEEVTEDTLNEEAMKTVTLTGEDEDGNPVETVYQYAQHGGIFLKEDGYNFTIWGAGPAEIETIKLKEENAMLTECVLEMSEIVYGGEL